MRMITVKQVEHIAFRLAREMLTYNEPIPDFSTRFPNILESCLSTPFQTFGKKDLYRSLVAKASIMFYLMIKNHPFQNGNKRVAMTTLLVFLYKNKKWLKVDAQKLYNFAMWVTESPADAKDEVVHYIEKFITEHATSLESRG